MIRWPYDVCTGRRDDIRKYYDIEGEKFAPRNEFVQTRFISMGGQRVTD